MNKYDERMNKSKLFFMISELYNKKKYNLFIKKANKFLEMYPDDLSVYYMRGKAERELRDYESAIKDFELVYNIDNRTNALVELFYLYYFTKKYNKAMNLLSVVEKRNAISEEKLKVIKLVLKNKLGLMTIRDNFELDDYQSFQIADYSYRETLKHLRSHEKEKDDEKSQFNNNINLDYLLFKLKKFIIEENKYNMKSTLDIYYFGLSGIGFDRNGDISNYIKVVVVPGTKDIITAYPVSSVNCEVVNIDYDRNKMFSQTNDKQKILSQIERFNKRYNKGVK